MFQNRRDGYASLITNLDFGDNIDLGPREGRRSVPGCAHAIVGFNCTELLNRQNANESLFLFYLYLGGDIFSHHFEHVFH